MSESKPLSSLVTKLREVVAEAGRLEKVIFDLAAIAEMAYDEGVERGKAGLDVLPFSTSEAHAALLQIIPEGVEIITRSKGQADEQAAQAQARIPAAPETPADDV